jgi:hypothetical protein
MKALLLDERPSSPVRPSAALLLSRAAFARPTCRPPQPRLPSDHAPSEAGRRADARLGPHQAVIRRLPITLASLIAVAGVTGCGGKATRPAGSYARA